MATTSEFWKRFKLPNGNILEISMTDKDPEQNEPILKISVLSPTGQFLLSRGWSSFTIQDFFNSIFGEKTSSVPFPKQNKSGSLQLLLEADSIKENKECLKCGLPFQKIMHPIWPEITMMEVCGCAPRMDVL